MVAGCINPDANDGPTRVCLCVCLVPLCVCCVVFDCLLAFLLVSLSVFFFFLFSFFDLCVCVWCVVFVFVFVCVVCLRAFLFVFSMRPCLRLSCLCARSPAIWKGHGEVESHPRCGGAIRRADMQQVGALKALSRKECLPFKMEPTKFQTW